MSVIQDPCIACGKQVRPRQESVECDWCSRWQHRTCGTGISRHAYREASKRGWLTFVCKRCIEKEPTYEGPPVLELSVPLPSTAANQKYIIADREPTADSTPVNDSFSREGDLEQSFDISDGEDDGEPFFDISDREVEEVVPIPETSQKVQRRFHIRSKEREQVVNHCNSRSKKVKCPERRQLHE